MAEIDRLPADQPSRNNLDELARSERFLDALATRATVDFADTADAADTGDDVLAALLEEWRDELRWPPASDLVSDAEAVVALERGLAARGFNRRGLAAAGAVAAAMLTLGGLGAMIGSAHPGDQFYGVHTMLFGEQPSVHDDQIELSAKTELAEVVQMIAQGQWDQAQHRLSAVSDSVQNVNDTNRKQNLIDQVNELNAKVATRDPNATLAPGAPLDSAIVPPSASEPSSDAPTEAPETGG